MAIYVDEQTRTFYLESKNTTYAFCANPFGFLQHIYFGKRIAREDLSYGVFLNARGHGSHIPHGNWMQSLNQYSNECPTFGRSDYRESAVAFDFDGVRVFDWQYVGYTILKTKPPLEGMPSVRGNDTLVVSMRDERTGAAIDLSYTVFDDVPVILRHAVIRNGGKKPFTVDRAYSFCLDLPDADWQAVTLYGAHTRERFMQRADLKRGVFSVDSKRGVTSGQMNPFAAFVRKNTDENTGEAYGVNLVYSGDFVLKAQIEESDTVRVLGGINDYDFSWRLEPDQTFTTPEAVLVYAEHGLGEMSRAFHDLYRAYLVNPRYVRAPRPVVLNSWEAAYFDFDEKKLLEIIDATAKTGVDTFVLDDGWFGARNGDDAGLGDWVVNTQKLPHGLTPLIERTHERGLKFGLWFEPEMVNPDSDLFRAHPDWAIHVDGLEPCPGRNQLVLDLTRDEVCDYIVGAVSKVLRENAIDYVKWDMNRCLTENYSAHLGARGKETHHRYVLGLYKICERIVNGFPHIFFEGCAGGGCRFDPAMLYYFPQIWTSDKSDAYWRTVIQYGTSLCYPVSAMSCHVSDCPNHQCGRVTPFSSRGDIAHLGATGYEFDPTRMSAEEIAAMHGQIAAYKDMQDLVLNGDLYRLHDPLDSNLFAFELVSKDGDRAHITVMRTLCLPNDKCLRLFPRGLDENATYFIPETGVEKAGSTLMYYGLIVNIPFGDFTTATYTLLRR